MGWHPVNCHPIKKSLESNPIYATFLILLFQIFNFGGVSKSSKSSFFIKENSCHKKEHNSIDLTNLQKSTSFNQ